MPEATAYVQFVRSLAIYRPSFNRENSIYCIFGGCTTCKAKWKKNMNLISVSCGNNNEKI